MLSQKLITTGFSLVLTATAVLGGLHGNAMTSQALEELDARERVSTFIATAAADAQAHEAARARTALEGFQPTLDTAAALVTSSDGKASAESRAALQSILDEVAVKTSARTETGVQFREIVDQSIATATPAIAAASELVTDEVNAWEAAEASRIEAERIAAEEAAREASPSNGSGDSGYSGGGSNGGSSNNGGGGGGSCTDRYAATAAANGARFEIIDGNTSYYLNGVIQMGRGPAGACADEVFNHELAHHFTMGSYGADCAVKSRELTAAAGLSQRHVETWAQAYTQRYWGWSADWAYTRAPQAYIDGMVTAGCL